MKIFDIELIGRDHPVFLCGVLDSETLRYKPYWLREATKWEDKTPYIDDMASLLRALRKSDTWVGFNSQDFDRPLIAAAIDGCLLRDMKAISAEIIEHRLKSFMTYRQFNIPELEYDHIDLFELPPGVGTSLKVYEGRMALPTMMDMPFPHDEDVYDDLSKLKLIEKYNKNDCLATLELLKVCKEELESRIALGEQFDIDLRSKSRAQCAEAIFTKALNLPRAEKRIPHHVEYTAQKFIVTNHPTVQHFIDLAETTDFKLNPENGRPISADWMPKYKARKRNGEDYEELVAGEECRLGHGIYKIGLGGLHSKHDTTVFYQEDAEFGLSDFDVASYYPALIIYAGFQPSLPPGLATKWLALYEEIFRLRLELKRIGNKKASEPLKILLNGTFGKMLELFCRFYSPQAGVGITLTGQLNLLCLIADIESIKGCQVLSANTDGILVRWPRGKREKLLAVIAKNSQRTKFEYEETPYKCIGFRDVNNYIAITTEGKAKRKGAYAIPGVMENISPDMQICADAVVEFLKSGASIEEGIHAASKDVACFPRFLSIANMKAPGGVQHTHEVLVDDWVGSARHWRRPAWAKERVDEQRVSRPAPVLEGRGGQPFGRVARWYMTTKKLPPITYVESGNKVANTDGARLCLTLPRKVPADLDVQWYIDRAYKILKEIGYGQPPSAPSSGAS